MKTVRSLGSLAVIWIATVLQCAGCNQNDSNGFWSGTPTDSLTEATPQFIQYDPPIMPTPDINAFLHDGCQVKNGHDLDCPTDSPLSEFECSYLLTPDPILGALQPAYPIAKCQLGYDKNPSESGNFIYEEGCLDHRWVQFIIFRDGQYQPIRRAADLQAAYAPIESPEEALSYAVATTGLKARFDLTPSPDYRYEVSQIEETHIKVIDDTFTINLFEYKSCGCGPHPLSMVVVSVARDGQVFSAAPTDLFRNPELDKICGD